MAEFVFPHCAAHGDEIEKIKGINRLYAYPATPRFNNDSNIVILDSGAYGLSVSGQKMNTAYMMKLSEHYEKYHSDNTLCIAPDEFLNPVQSMLNLRKWLSKGLYKDVTAVIQAESKNRINLDGLIYQADYYKCYTDTACFSNNCLTGAEAQYLRIERLFEYMKSIGYKWIHILGAGWNIQDIKDWMRISYFDSMDTIAYYATRDIKAYGSLNPVENIRRIGQCIKDLQI